MPEPRRWRLVRMPESLAQRLERLAADAGLAYAEGRIDIPDEFTIELVRAYYAIADQRTRHQFLEMVKAAAQSREPPQ